LEEITAEEYEYFPMKMESEPPCLSTTFIEAEGEDWSGEKIRLKLKRRMYEEANKINADAIIHYRYRIFKKNRGYGGFVEGTPVRKCNKNFEL